MLRKASRVGALRGAAFPAGTGTIDGVSSDQPSATPGFPLVPDAESLARAELFDLDSELPSGHPGGHGQLQLRLLRDPEGLTVAWCEPVLGAMHRGAEKLLESRDYRSALMLADRHDWLSAFGSELGLAQTVESLLGLQVPERAVWLRTALAELNRITHHRIWLGADVGPGPDLMERFSGGRIHPMIVRYGGLAANAGADWLADLDAFAAAAESEPAADRTAAPRPGLAVLDRADALAAGASGPVLRASGVDQDLRRDAPYAAYGEMEFDVVTAHAGDAAARYEVLIEEIVQSARIIRQVVAGLPEGPVSVQLPKVLRPARGVRYGRTENPTGVNGWYLESRAERTPYRLKVRSASFGNARATTYALPGTPIDDLATALASFLLVPGDMDR